MIGGRWVSLMKRRILVDDQGGDCGGLHEAGITGFSMWTPCHNLRVYAPVHV